MASHHDLSNFIWSVADLLRGPYRPPQYERVMLPLTVLRRFDCVLAPTKDRVLEEYARLKQKYPDVEHEVLIEKQLSKVSGQAFHNHSLLNFDKLLDDSEHIATHLASYINGFSRDVRTIFEYFDFSKEIEVLAEANRLYEVIKRFRKIDLHPDRVDNIAMGQLFEDLIRRFNEQANETAGDHFTPREVIELMVEMLLRPNDELLSRRGAVARLCDPACGTGGMLAVAQSHLHKLNSSAQLHVYGQDYNKRSYAIAASDMLIKGQRNARIQFGDTLTQDQFGSERFDYLLANPPFGVDWKGQLDKVKAEHEKQGFKGRFGAGLPRVNDGSLLFLQHMISKFEPYEPDANRFGTRIGIVFNGSPLFSGGAGSGESEIRKWIIESDWLEAIVALPEQMFYNTGIGTYIWIVSNRKSQSRKNKIQLIDARARWRPLRRSLGDKRRELGPDDIAHVLEEYAQAAQSETSKMFESQQFGYTRLTIERPLRLRFQMTPARAEAFLQARPLLRRGIEALQREFGSEAHDDWNVVSACVAKALKGAASTWSGPEKKLLRDVFCHACPEAVPVRKGDGLEPDAALRDFENVPLQEDARAWFGREVRPHVPDAWVDWDKTKVGYEIPFNRYFYKYLPPRPLEEIDGELKAVENRILELLQAVTK